MFTFTLIDMWSSILYVYLRLWPMGVRNEVEQWAWFVGDWRQFKWARLSPII